MGSPVSAVFAELMMQKLKSRVRNIVSTNYMAESSMWEFDVFIHTVLCSD